MNMRFPASRNFVWLSSASLLFSAALHADMARAQETSAQASVGANGGASPDSSDEGVEVIVVTAQKRAQSLQDVPLSVTAITADTLERARVVDLSGIALRTPSFQIGNDGPTTPELTIRGIGSTDREAGSDRSVVLFVNEVYIGRTGASTFDLFDLERVEVLRGPQGSLFGRNVVGGAISLIHAKPTDKPLATFQATAGNHGLLESRAVLNGPIAENLAGRISLSARKQNGLDVDCY